MSKPIGWYGADLQEFYTPEQYEEFVKYEVTEGLIPLYTKREWVGLTDEEENDIYIKNLTTANNFVRAAEAKLKEKNT